MTPEGKVAVVTGAGSGIGRASAGALAKVGARLLACDIDYESAQQTVSAIERNGGKAFALHADVSKPDDVKRMIDAAVSRFGGLDILHNNAGILSGPRFPDSDPSCWMRAISVNIMGVLSGIHYGTEAMRQRGCGVIINTASISGLKPHFSDPVYAATKAAVVNLTRSLAFLKKEANIRVNCICPGFVRTDLESHSAAVLDPEAQRRFRSRRAGFQDLPALEPDDIARAVMMLINEDGLNGKACIVEPGEPWRVQ
ncbi:SDR family NAD(P)-dependent oxidoreductase [Bradyrhizobium sp. CCBAU 11386]|uniref:SDR family NAD(P)-dependent oxidoreductase n=1 Tax=Bradyrhizobium sp. CCBAU 11386 TaxID=1630837 RepID=UPI002303B9AA|nr:SDR family oxidoreductase [Bradyrhizobium sp. CCBAU 11386]